ncbi:hypothetical protein Scep_021144 [Stephania cephalantha]|uniref:VWFA domain-containing protein n=1 Tax=Stephania cephalantha TaxID=152367 RepID=A0AAP0F5K7_9MAGN
MGASNSRGKSYRDGSILSSRSASSSQGHPVYPPPQSPYYPPTENHVSPNDHAQQQNYTPQYAYPPQPNYALPPPNYGHQTGRVEINYSKIADDYSSLDEVTQALSRGGLESSNLIVGIDFTKSNEWTGAKSFNCRSLHHTGDCYNPYEQAISIIGRTLSAFDDDNLIPCFGFGDASTHDQDVFSFYSDQRPCNGFEEALARYREIVPQLRLSGPTSFAPIIEMAMSIVQQSGGQYHVLLIVADGQVTRSENAKPGRLSSQEQMTIDAIVKASEFPLSIILVGVGDGPWDMMKEFDDNIPARSFDNFQFVSFTEIMLKNIPQFRKDTEFALTALMEIPSQYKATIELGLLGNRQKRDAPGRVPLPPPLCAASFLLRTDYEAPGGLPSLLFLPTLTRFFEEKQRRQTIMDNDEMASETLCYHRLREVDELGDQEVNNVKASRIKRVSCYKRRTKVRIPSLKKFLQKRRKFRLFSAFRKSWGNVLKRWKESKSRFGDLFAGNYMFIHVNPSSLKCAGKSLTK